MKSIKDLREQYDLITEKEEHDMNKLTQLVRAGLFDAKKISSLKRAMEKPADKMTAQEKRMMINLLDALMSEVLNDKQVYRKIKQDVMKEAKDWDAKDYLSKADPRIPRGYPPAKELPSVLLLKRKAIRVFPDGQKVALYYAQAVDRYISVPYNEIGINESRISSIISGIADAVSSSNNSSSSSDGISRELKPLEREKTKLDVSTDFKGRENYTTGVDARRQKAERDANAAMAKGVKESVILKLQTLSEARKKTLSRKELENLSAPTPAYLKKSKEYSDWRQRVVSKPPDLNNKSEYPSPPPDMSYKSKKDTLSVSKKPALKPYSGGELTATTPSGVEDIKDFTRRVIGQKATDVISGKIKDIDRLTGVPSVVGGAINVGADLGRAAARKATGFNPETGQSVKSGDQNSPKALTTRAAKTAVKDVIVPVAAGAVAGRAVGAMMPSGFKPTPNLRSKSSSPARAEVPSDFDVSKPTSKPGSEFKSKFRQNFEKQGGSNVKDKASDFEVKQPRSTVKEPSAPEKTGPTVNMSRTQATKLRNVSAADQAITRQSNIAAASREAKKFRDMYPRAADTSAPKTAEPKASTPKVDTATKQTFEPPKVATNKGDLQRKFDAGERSAGARTTTKEKPAFKEPEVAVNKGDLVPFKRPASAEAPKAKKSMLSYGKTPEPKKATTTSSSVKPTTSTQYQQNTQAKAQNQAAPETQTQTRTSEYKPNKTKDKTDEKDPPLKKKISSRGMLPALALGAAGAKPLSSLSPSLKLNVSEPRRVGDADAVRSRQSSNERKAISAQAAMRESKEINLDGNQFVLNKKEANKVLSLYESLNTKNKKKMVKMMNEGSDQLNKIVSFAVRQ